MINKVRIVLIGIGGYGNAYVDELLKHINEDIYEIAGVVDSYPEGCQWIEDIRQSGIPVFSSIQEFYDNFRADLAVIATPIQFHCEHACYAMNHGSNVLCEKPAAAVVQDVVRMMGVRDRTEKFAAVGYQWSFSKAVLDLKRDILSGKFGKPKRLKSMVLWPRGKDYYARAWAARKMDSNGRWVLDSVAANAAAHYLHNMFFVLGDQIDTSAGLESLQAETYRANRIQNYDTSAIRAFTHQGTEILFIASHAISVHENKGPVFEYIFENAVIRYTYSESGTDSIVSIMKDGTSIDYGSPNECNMNKLWASIKAVQNSTNILTCGLEAASTHTICINGIQESVPDAHEFPRELIHIDKSDNVVFVEGLGNILSRCYDEWKMPWEAGVEWAHAGQHVNLSGYSFFKGA